MSLVFPPGEPVPDVDVRTPADEPRHIGEFITGPTLLVFLRHLH